MYSADNIVIKDDEGTPCVVIWGPDGPGMGRALVYYGEHLGDLSDEEMLEKARRVALDLSEASTKR